MTIRELIIQLENAADEIGNNAKVCLEIGTAHSNGRELGVEISDGHVLVYDDTKH